ncbi:hypothetical protein NSX56_23675, partial [Salmonella enterica]|nr:hypothetical protein [Salmonella enterica]
MDGTDDEIRRAGAILSNRGIQNWGIYDVPKVDSVRADYTATDVGVVNTPRSDYPTNVVDTEPKVIIVDRVDTVRTDDNVVELYDTP